MTRFYLFKNKKSRSKKKVCIIFLNKIKETIITLLKFDKYLYYFYLIVN